MISSRASLAKGGTGQVLLLFLAAFLLYLPAISGAVISIDDMGILRFYATEHLRLSDVLRPGHGYYYRPLTELSYFLDARLLQQNPYLLHLENVLIHALNTALLFLFARRVAPEGSPVPLLASLAFAVHPVNCEAISWIAGRTDPLAAAFVLLAALSLAAGLDRGKTGYTLLAVPLLFAGALAKETALLFIPASLLLAWSWPRLRPGACREAAKRQLTLLSLCYGLVVVGFCLIFAYRSGAGGNILAKVVAADVTDPLGSLLLALKLLGFYLKKMVMPWPLAFAITSVAGWYLVPGVFGIFLCLAALGARYGVFFLMGVLFLVPAVFVGVFDLTWTVAAERYLYLPSAFFSIAMFGSVAGLAERFGLRRALVPAVTLCLLVVAVLTVHRTQVWRSNIALFSDSVEKAPDFAIVRNELATAYLREGMIEEARAEFEVASGLARTPLARQLVRDNMVLVQIHGKSPEEARATIKALDPVPKLAPEFLRVLRAHDYALLNHAPQGRYREELLGELIEINQLLYEKNPDPLLLYNNGQLQLELGRKGDAARSFARSHREAPQDAYYREPAKRLALKLGETLP